MLCMRTAAPLKTGLAALALGAMAQVASAQGQNPASVQIPPAQNGPGTPTAAAPSPAPEQPLPAARIDQLVAPVALYPDPLLSQVLTASTYPLEVIEAAQWISVPANRALTGDALSDALKPKNWDPSIMALIAFPRVLSLMADKFEWTEQLGKTFLAQQADVMAQVEKLRHEALVAGKPNLTPQVAAARAAPARARYHAYRPAYRYAYNYSPYYYGPVPYYYGPAPYHGDGY